MLSLLLMRFAQPPDAWIAWVCGPWSSWSRLNASKSEDMAQNSFLAHTGSDGSNPGERVARAGYDWHVVAENVASGQTSADEIAATWLESPGHCENLRSAKYSESGLAYALNPGDGRDIYWVQVYAQ